MRAEEYGIVAILPGIRTFVGEALDFSALHEQILRSPGIYVDASPGMGIARIAFSMLVDALHSRGARLARLTIRPDGVLELADDGQPQGCRTEDWIGWETGDLSAHPPVPYARDLYVLAAVSELLQARTGPGAIAFRCGRRVDPATLDLEEGAANLQLRPSVEIFGPRPSVELFPLLGWARNYAATSPGTTIQLVSAEGHERTFAYPRGLVDLGLEMSFVLAVVPPEHFECEIGERRVSVVVGRWGSGPIQIASFVNHWRTWGHGSHVRGILRALQEIHGEGYENAGLLVLVSAILPHPNWRGSIEYDKVLDLELAEILYRECIQRFGNE